jgi:hypothetical protein
MAYFLFVDESGHDLLPSPAEVIAGLAIEDKDLWNIILEIKALEIRSFGRRYPKVKEIKARRFLVRSVFKKSKRLENFPEEERQGLAKTASIMVKLLKKSILLLWNKQNSHMYWGFRLDKSKGSAIREDEFEPYVELIKPMRYRTIDAEGWEIWSIVQVKK